MKQPCMDDVRRERSNGSVQCGESQENVSFLEIEIMDRNIHSLERFPHRRLASGEKTANRDFESRPIQAGDERLHHPRRPAHGEIGNQVKDTDPPGGHGNSPSHSRDKTQFCVKPRNCRAFSHASLSDRRRRTRRKM